MNKHTSGPWSLRRSQLALGWIVWGNEKRIASLQAEEDSGENTANALLCAAAPDLLEALEAAMSFLPKTSAKEGGASGYSEAVKVADKARAAISKAKGQS